MMIRNLTIGMFIAITGLVGAVRAADDNVIWQIGKPDHDFRDLTPVGDLATYEKAFPKDTSFVVGQSDPAKDFAAIHPGPSDAWAGKRAHTVRITFNLDAVPQGPCELRIDLVDTRDAQPPGLNVRVNKQQARVALEPGTGEITLTRPEKGKARALRFVFGPEALAQGPNQIELHNDQGSWLLYDSLTLTRIANAASLPIEVSIRPSMFFVERDGNLKQEFAVSLTGIASGEPAKVQVRAGEQVLETATLKKPSLGTITDVVHVAPADSPRELTVSVSAGQQSGSGTAAQVPQRKWRIYVAPSTHTDIGYTDIQDKVIELHNRNTDLALELVREFPLYHWNLESSWAAQMWLRDRPPYRHDELYEAARQRRIGIESGYLNMLTGLCSEEELIRNLYYSARLHREFKIPFSSHTLTDAPSHVWSVPTVLAGAGIRCISVGVNGIRAPLLPKGKLHDRSPFWWEGPDGSRVLAWFTPGYSQAGQIGLKSGVDRMRVSVEALLYRLQQREDYPYDAMLLHGAYSDNVAIGRDIAESLAAYSKRYAYPKVVMGANDDFFNYIEEHFADKLPTVRGCGGSWWEDGAGSSAAETGICRVTHQDIIAAEAVWAAATGASDAAHFPQHQFNRVWDNILLYDEHTWGAHNSMTEPTRDFVQRQWAIKAAYATDAADQTRRLLNQGLQRLAVRVNAPDGSLLVFNPAGRARTGVVQADIPRNMLIMDDSGPVPQQVIRQDVLENRTVAFVARDVPAVGYRTYRIGPDAGSLTSPPKRFDGKVLENDFYRVTFDPATGAIASLMDKTLGKELVDQASAYKFGQVIYDVGGQFDDGHYQHWGPNREKITTHLPREGSIQPGTAGPVFSSVKTPVKLDGFRTVELETILYEQDRRVDFVLRLDKIMTYEREALYVAFPIAGADPKFRYEVGGGNVRPNEDHIPGACRDWFAVQRWVTVHTNDAAVAFTPVDTPLITLCERTPGKWLDELPITNGTIYAYALNNYWFTNYKAGQDGWFTLRFSLSSDQAIEPGAAALFGESVVQPMRAVCLQPTRKPMDLPASHSFCQVAPANVTLTTVKRADDGQGLVVRVRETAGKDTDVIISTGLAGVTKASRCDLVERVQGPMPISDGKLSFKIGAHAMATVRLE